MSALTIAIYYFLGIKLNFHYTYLIYVIALISFLISLPTDTLLGFYVTLSQFPPLSLPAHTLLT